MTPAERRAAARDAADAWLARRHGGRWTAADEASFAAWLAADPQHAAAWREATALWQQLGGLRRLAADELRGRRGAAWRPWWPALGGLAGGLLLALTCALPGSLAPPQTVATARGESRTLTLPDGSGLTLDAASRVVIDYGPTCRCLRLLAGNALFAVSHGDPRPFAVRSAGGEVRDIGTEFVVDRSGERSTVAVLAGLVEVRPDGRPARRLQAGEALALDGSPAGAAAATLAAWRNGELVFSDAPLAEVLGEFQRYHALAVEIDSRLASIRLSGRFASRDLDGLLGLLQRAWPIAVQRQGERLRLTLRRG